MSVNGLVFNVGVNDVRDGKSKTCPYYSSWKDMLRRCYDKNHHSRFPTYVGCSVQGSWKYFSNFKSWMMSQDWEGKVLDKDIINFGNKVYSEINCRFVNPVTNTIFTASIRPNKRSSLPLGVFKDKRKFKAQCSTRTGLKYLGTFLSTKEAAAAYLVQKEIEVRRCIAEEVDLGVKAGLETLILNLWEGWNNESL